MDDSHAAVSRATTGNPHAARKSDRIMEAPIAGAPLQRPCPPQAPRNLARFRAFARARPVPSPKGTPTHRPMRRPAAGPDAPFAASFASLPVRTAGHAGSGWGVWGGASALPPTSRTASRRPSSPHERASSIAAYLFFQPDLFRETFR